MYHDLLYGSISDERVNDYALDVSTIPSFPQHRCSFTQHYRDRFGACTCDGHCSWDLCRKSIPPSDCLLGTHSTWKWDKVKNAWVAQIIQGNICNLKSIGFHKN